MSHCLANSAIDSLCGVHWQGCGCVNDIHKINFDVDACRPHFCPIAVFNLCIMYKMHVALPRAVAVGAHPMPMPKLTHSGNASLHSAYRPAS